jgi:alcohol dehydrogenase
MKIIGAVLEEIGRSRPFTDSKPVSIVELELDDPGPGEVLVKIEAAGICHSDLSVVDGNRVRPVMKRRDVSSPWARVSTTSKSASVW